MNGDGEDFPLSIYIYIYKQNCPAMNYEKRKMMECKMFNNSCVKLYHRSDYESRILLFVMNKSII